jgi:hypothetical protein
LAWALSTQQIYVNVRVGSFAAYLIKADAVIFGLGHAHLRGPLYLNEQTFSVSVGRSEKCHEQTSSVAGIQRPSVLAVLSLMTSSSPVGYHTAAFRWLALASRVGHEFVTSRDAKFTGARHKVV